MNKIDENSALQSNSRNVLMWILILGAIVRLIAWWIWADEPVRIVDAQDYNRLAIGLVETGSYLTPSGELSSLRPPLYSAFIAGVYQVFGLENYAAVRAIQNLISLFTVYCVYLIGRDLYDEKTGLFSAGIICFYPSLIGFNNLLLSETLFTLSVTFVTMGVIRSVQRRSLRWLILIGVAMALGALLRSILWLFAPFLSLFLFLMWQGNFVKRFQAAVIPMFVFLLILSPWIYRNTKLHNTFTVIDVMGGRNAMMGNYEHTPLERNWATITIVQGEKAWFRVLAKETPNYSELTQGQIDKVAMKHGIHFVLKNPFLTAKRDIVRFFNFWQIERTLIAGGVQGVFGDIPKSVLIPGAIVIAGSYVFVFFAGIFGAIFFRAKDWKLYGFVIFSIAFPCAIHTLIFAHSRYHLPVIPLISVFAAAAIANRAQVRSIISRRAFLVIPAIYLIFVLAWLREIVFVDLGSLKSVVS